jgi:hypothetical protein
MPIPTELKYGFILAFFILVFLIGWNFAVSNLECIKDPWNCIKSPLELAVECSEYRCTEGCDSINVKKIKTNKFDCSEFCLPEWQDENKKICGDNAIKHPVIIENFGTRTFSKDDFAVDCIIQKDGLDLGFIGDIWNTVTRDKIGGPKYIVVDKNLVKEPKTETCFVAWTPFPNSLVSFSLDPSKKINLFTVHRSWIGFSSTTTYLWSSDYCSDCSCNDKNLCESCNENGINQCYFWEAGRQCVQRDNIQCYLSGGGASEDLCLESGAYFCELEGKNLLAKGCVNDRCYRECGNCDEIETYNDFPSYLACVYNTLGIICGKTIDLMDCCNLVNSCSDYPTLELCQQNDCYSKVGPCYWEYDAATETSSCISSE